ncbi:MAG: hypothetical protein SGJ00_14975 [bacterium]|nr:hypothetical protein [bacterium]
MKLTFNILIFGIFINLLLPSCKTDEIEKKKIIHRIIDDGEWFYDHDVPIKYVFYKDGIYYTMFVSYDVITKTYGIQAIYTCKPYYRNGEYFNCVGDGIVITYSGERTDVFEMKSAESDCISSRKDMSQRTGWYFSKDSKNRIYEKGAYKNRKKEGIFMYFDTLGNIKQLDKYHNDSLISSIQK